MAAFIKKLFKNRKPDNIQQQPDLSQLSPDNPKDLEHLLSLVKSGDSNGQRNAALERIPHIQHLIPLYADASANLRNRLAKRINTLAKTHPSQIDEAMQALTDPQQQAVIHQLCQSADTTVDQVSAETDPGQLLNLAIEGKTAAVRLAAAERVEGESNLLAVQKATKGRDKSVYQLTRKKLQALRQDQEKAVATRAAIDDLAKQAEDHAKTENMQLYAARVESLQTQWKTLAEQASNEQTTAFLTAIDACKGRIREAEQVTALAAEAEQKQTERKATVEMLRGTLEDLKQSVPDRGPSLSSLDALQKTQENRWMEATRETEVGKNEQKDYQTLMLELRHYISAVQRLATNQEVLQKLADAEAPDATELRQTLDTIDWPAGYVQPAQLDTLSHKLGHVRQAKKTEVSDQKAQQRTLDDLLNQLEAALEQDQFSESRQLHKQAQHAFNVLDHKHASSRHARLTLLGRQLQDLQDWRGFATRPKQEELCEAMEYLATQHMEPEAKAVHIKELQTEWRNLGGSSDQSLWQRFKQASDQAYEPCQAYFAAKSELKKMNLDKRQAICDELNAFANNADWSRVDWKAVERIHRVAREEWREAWPVDFKANRSLQKTFDHLLKKIEAPLNEERQRNENQKQSIVERAEALITHDPLNEAMEQAKALQKEWEVVGVTRHREDRKLWQAFRAACDAIFARRDEQRAEQAAEDSETLTQLRQCITDAQTVHEQSNAGIDTLKAALQSLRKAPTPRRLPADISEALTGEKQRLEAEIRQHQRQQRIDSWAERLEQGATETVTADAKELPTPIPAPREVVIRLEIATGVSSPEEDQTLRMQQQVERLAAGMGSSQAATSTEDEIERLVTCWCAQAIAPEDATALLPRLRKALSHWQG